MNMPVSEKIMDKNLQTSCKEEIMECSKHDIISEISKLISDCPSSIAKAEDIFDSLKYSIAQHVMKYELEDEYYDNTSIQFLLEEKAQPAAVNELNSIIDQYLI